MFAQALDTQFAREVRAGLTQPEQKTLPCRYLYDDIGSALFEAITFLPEYGLTRADARVIEAHAGELLDCLPSKLMIAELGSGSGAKTRSILERAQQRQSTIYYPIDVSASALARCAQELGPLGDCGSTGDELSGWTARSHRRTHSRTVPAGALSGQHDR